MSELKRHDGIDGRPHPKIDPKTWESLPDQLQKSLAFNANRSFADQHIEELNQTGKDIIVLAKKLNTASNYLRENALRILSESKDEKSPEQMERNRSLFVALLKEINAGIKTLKDSSAQLIEIVKQEVG